MSPAPASANGNGSGATFSAARGGNGRAPAHPGRVPPHNTGAEEALLGAMLLSRDAIGDAVQLVAAADFYKPALAHVFDAVVGLWSRGEPADPVTTADELARRGLLDQAGGPAALITLQTSTPATSNAGRYARIVRDHSLLRRLIGAAAEVAELGYSVPEDVEEAVDEAERLVFAVAGDRRDDTTHRLADMVRRGLDRLEELELRGDTVVGLPSGYHELDQMTLGYHPGQLVVVGARPGAGKTAFAIGTSLSAALDSVPALFFSLEMSEQEITQRLLAHEARVDLTRVRNGRLTEADKAKIGHATTRLATAALTVDDDAAANVMTIRAKARRAKARGGLGLVVVDYLQLMAGRRGAESRQVEVSEMSRGLKVLARELGVPVIALSQLSRGVEMRADKRPGLADLRETGQIEADADVVVLLYRADLYDADGPDRGVAEAIVAKNRNGPTGTARLAFMPQYTRFANMARPS